MVKGLIEQEAGTVMNLHKPNNRPGNYMKQKLSELKGEIENSIIIVEISILTLINGQDYQTENS